MGGFGLLQILLALVLGLTSGASNEPLPGGAEIVLTAQGQIYTIPADQIASVVARTGEFTGTPVVVLELSAEGAELLAQVTTAHLNQQLDLAVCGEVLMFPTVREPITGGSLLISGGFSMEEATTLAGRIAGQVPCG